MPQSPAAARAMNIAAELARRHASELRGIDAALPGLLERAASALQERLGEDDLHAWARLGLGLARRSGRSPELAVAFFTSSAALGALDARALSRWAELAGGLGDRAPRAAVAFVAATPAALAHLEPGELEGWAGQGLRLCRESFKSAKLAERFFHTSPDLLASLSLQALDRLVDVVARLGQRSHEAASLCLKDAASQLRRLCQGDREPFLALAQAVCADAWTETQDCLERGPDLLRAVAPGPRRGLLALAEAAACEAAGASFSRFAAAAEALARLDAREQAWVVEFAGRLMPHAGAAIASVVSAPRVRERLAPPEARRWSEAGLWLLTEGRGAERAESYFRIESTLASETLAELAGRVELHSVASRLRLYANALSGEPLLVQPTTALVGRNVGWADAAACTTDGGSIYLPPEVDLFGDQRANFQVYKVQTTHQAGRLEFGAFRYRFGVDGAHLRSSALERASSRPVPGPDATLAASPVQRFYDLFDDGGLVSELFGLAESTRVDACIREAYPGIRRALCRLQEFEVARRADVEQMPLRQAFVENLVRASLGRSGRMRWPERLAARLAHAVAALRVVEREGASVQDSAEVAAALYDLALGIPNLPPHLVRERWRAFDDDAVCESSWAPEAEVPVGAEVPYTSPGGVEYRGDFKPGLVQLRRALAGPGSIEEGGAPLTREQILELLARSPEVELVGESDAHPDSLDTLEALLARIERESDEFSNEARESETAEADPAVEIDWFAYDEWDFRAGDYRPDWCRVGQRSAAQGELGFYAETLRRYHGLVVETRRQFERMRPEAFRRIKRLEDGHEIDLDQAIEFHADKRAGAGPLARFYTRRNKITRDVAVAFLLDMSGSTGEPVLGPGRPEAGDKRIIDVEREAAVLVVEALEAVGDAYAIYGFSGRGRDNVEFHVIKDLDEALDDGVRRRIDAIEPMRATRMGPAIRHTIAKLDAHAAKVKILILVSDGRPQDEEYGHSPSERDYAVHDTRRALLEAKRHDIAPFLIAVDAEGHDYLRHMCDDIGYEVVADIESLPRRLPKLYRHLAGE